MFDMTSGEVSLFIGLMINAMVIVWATWLGRRKINAIQEDITKVEKSTNSMHDKIVKETRETALAQGEKIGRAKGKTVVKKK